MKIPFYHGRILTLLILLLNASQWGHAQSIHFSASSLPVASEGYGHGASFGAFTRNGRPSLFVIAYDAPNNLYDNIGASFRDIAEQAGVQFGTAHDRGMASADYDNDGDTDIYISAGYTGNVFWRNNGDDTYSDITSESGTSLNGQGQGVAWGDFNSDGWLDLFVAQTDGGNRMYINNGGGSFYENSGGFISQSASIQPVAFDVNDDGYTDILVTRTGGSSNLLYLNGGGGGFGEQGNQWGIGAASADCQGAAVGDYDRDGDLDVFICNFGGDNLLFRNTGGHFDEVGGAAGIRAGGDRNRGAVFGDFNDDGWPDIYVTRDGANQLFHNNGNGTFTEVGAAAGANDSNSGYSPSIADYDNDGDLDVFFTNTGQQSILLENLGSSNKWIEIRLRGTESNSNGIGAKLTAWMNGRPQAHAIIAGQGYVGTGSDLTAHFGLGGNSFLDSLVVRWPSGVQDKYYRLAANQKLSLFEGNAPVDRTAPNISNVSADNISPTGATIHWTTNENADSQVEYGNTTNYGSFSPRNANLVTTHTIILSNLTANTTYHFRVRSKDASGNLAVSNDFTLVTAGDIQAPALTNIVANNLTMNSAQIEWNSDEPADSQVEYGLTTSYGSSTTLNTALANSHSVALSGLSANTLYHYRVRSKDAAGNLAVSNDFTFTTARDTQAPALTSIAANNLTMTTAQIVWNSDEPADSQVEYGLTTNYGVSTPLDLTMVTAHAVTLSNLTANTVYHFRVRSKDVAGNLAVSNDFTFTTARDTQAPMLTSIAVNNVTMTTAQIVWNSDEPADSQIEYGLTTSYGVSTPLDLTMVTAHAITLSNLTANTLYHYRVRSKDTAGNLAMSSDFTFTTARDTQAPTISNITMTAITANSAQIKWNTDELSDARIEYGTDSTAFTNSVLDTSFVTSHTVSLVNLQAYTTYYFRIIAHDLAGNQQTGAKLHFTTLPTAAALTRVSGNAQSGRAGELLPLPLIVRVVNSAGEVLANMAVEFRVIAGGGRVSSESNCDSSVCVAATNSSGLASIKWRLGTSDSQKVQVTLPEKRDLVAFFTASFTPTTGIETTLAALPATLALRNYPNPFRELTRFEIALPHAGLISLKIYDLQGREVATLAEGSFHAGQHLVVWQAQTSAVNILTSGVYFAVLRYQNELHASSAARTLLLEKRLQLFYVK